MPFLRVKVDDSVVVEIPTDGCNMLGCRIGASRDDDDFADLSAWSGLYGQGADDVHRIWLDAEPLALGQSVEVEFVVAGTQIGNGVPFDSSESSELPADFSLESELHAVAQELRKLPWVRTAYKFRYEASDDRVIDCSMDDDEYGFGFNVLWNEMRPACVSVLLYAYTIESAEHQRDGRTLVREQVSVGQSCKITLVA